MRPMVFEFMNDPAVPYLDQQYMLGDALLVAPVFREDKVAQYYLPEGTWTELPDRRDKKRAADGSREPMTTSPCRCM